MNTPLQKTETDIDRLLQMMVKTFPLPFFVAKGGDELRIQLTDKIGELVLNRDGRWEFVKMIERSN